MAEPVIPAKPALLTLPRTVPVMAKMQPCPNLLIPSRAVLFWVLRSLGLNGAVGSLGRECVG